jgi:hypothetical protein
MSVTGGATMARYLAFVLVLFAATSADAAEKSLTRTFNVAPGGKLTVDADSVSVKVSAADSNQVTVRINVRASDEDLANAKVDAVQDANGVTVTMRLRNKDKWFSWSGNTEGLIEVTVPKRYSANVKTSGGSIELLDMVGAATLNTSGGQIVTKNVTGNLELRTSGGGILAESIRGDVDAHTSGGGVRLLDIDGKIKGHTSGGSVKCSLVGANRGISATTSGGSIQLIVPRNTSANIEASTSGGRITSDLPIAATDREDTHIEGSINGGGAPIHASTSGGGISLNAAG